MYYHMKILHILNFIFLAVIFVKGHHLYFAIVDNEEVFTIKA